MKMKNILSENMRRFGTMNLNEQEEPVGTNTRPPAPTDYPRLTLEQLPGPIQNFLKQTGLEASNFVQGPQNGRIMFVPPDGRSRYIDMGTMQEFKKIANTYNSLLKTQNFGGSQMTVIDLINQVNTMIQMSGPQQVGKK